MTAGQTRAARQDRTARLVGCAAAALWFAVPLASAQSRIEFMPGYENWKTAAPEISRSVKSGRISPEWSESSRSFSYRLGDKTWRYDLRRGTNAPVKAEQGGDADVDKDADAVDDKPPAPLVLARGRGGEADVVSPDGKLRAFTRDMNLFVAPTTGGIETALTTDGGVEARIRNGVGSYVYLEEFGVKSPVWWSPDSRMVAWMRYDETRVRDYVLALDQTKLFSTAHVQAYPHPGEANPVADLMVHDLETGETRILDVREGSPFGDGVVGHYVWDANWTAAGDEILVRRADRLQKIYDLAACSPKTGKCRSVVRETRVETWAEGSDPYFLKDGKRFIWTSERNEFRNFYLYDLDGKLIAPLTQHDFDVVDVLGVDESRDEVWYTARSGDNHMKVQLHRVKLDGDGDQRLTDPSLNHTVTPAPNFAHFVDVVETHDRPPTAHLLDRNGKKVSDVVLSDTTRFDKLGFAQTELFTFTSADGNTRLHGQIAYPSHFDPTHKYPVLVSVYAGPSSNAVSERYRLPDTITEFGFVVVRLDARSVAGRGRAILDSVYRNLGIAEVDDLAAGLRSLENRSWFDGRVGVFGTSYGGTVSALLLLRYPDLVQAAVSNSPVTDWRLYDSAYTERYLGLPKDHPDAYRNGAVLTYANRLKGDLLLYFGTSDDNVHPKNSLQLINALNSAGKSYDVQVGPDRGHTSVGRTRMMEFFIEKLVINPSRRD